MTGKTSIEWATAVWNPTTGCTRVSAGCDNCYAFALHDKRFTQNKVAAATRAYHWHEGTDAIQRARSDTARGNNPGFTLPWPKQYDLPFSRVQLLPDRLDDPLRHRKPERYFVDSMADLFHEDVPDDYLSLIWLTMQAAPWHTFLILTKRPQRMREWVNYRWPPEGPLRPPANVWLGTSVEDQAAADERIPHLLATPASVRFLSCEPLLAPVDLSMWIGGRCPHVNQLDNTTFARCLNCGARFDNAGGTWAWRTTTDENAFVLGGTGELTPLPRPRLVPRPRLDWVIVGGESGSRARPMDLVWARSLVEQCHLAGVPAFVKQLGSNPVEVVTTDTDNVLADVKLRESHGRDMDEWPDDLRLREFPR